MVSKLDQQMQLASDVVNALFEVDSVKDGLERERKQILEKAREDAWSQIQAEILAENEKLGVLRKGTAEQRKILDDLMQEIEVLRAEHGSMLDSLDETLTKRLQEILAKPEKTLAEIFLFRAASASSKNRVAGETPRVSLPVARDRPRPIGSIEDEERVSLITEVETLRVLLTKALQARDVSPLVARPMHATFLAGGLPVLTGSRAFEALAAYASCVTRGLIHWVPISAAMLEPADLLGRIDPTTQRFVPHASGVVDLLCSASQTESLHLVVLEGINRAAIDAYLLPLLACYTDAWRKSGSRAFPLFAPTAVTADDPYAAAHSLPWPSNVLLAGIVSEGTVTLSMPEKLF
jgi:hypothetical protein